MSDEAKKCDICGKSDAILMDFIDHTTNSTHNYCYVCYLYLAFRTQMSVTRNLIDLAQYLQKLALDNGHMEPRDA